MPESYRARLTRCNKDKTNLVHYKSECYLTDTYKSECNFKKHALPVTGCWKVEMYNSPAETYKGFAEVYYIQNGKRVEEKGEPA